MLKRLAAVAALLASLTLVTAASAMSDGPTPSGHRMFGNTSFDETSGHFTGGVGTIEPAYDDTTGTLVYLQTPNGPPVNVPQKIDSSTGLPVNVAPILAHVPSGVGHRPNGVELRPYPG